MRSKLEQMKYKRYGWIENDRGYCLRQDPLVEEEEKNKMKKEKKKMKRKK